MREIARGTDALETRARSHLHSNHHVRRIALGRSTLFSLIVQSERLPAHSLSVPAALLQRPHRARRPSLSCAASDTEHRRSLIQAPALRRAGVQQAQPRVIHCKLHRYHQPFARSVLRLQSSILRAVRSPPHQVLPVFTQLFRADIESLAPMLARLLLILRSPCQRRMLRPRHY